MNESDLLPCPFCGSAGEINRMPHDVPDAGALFIMCTNSRCMASTALVYPLMDNAEPLVAERWNRRPALAVPEPQLAASGSVPEHSTELTERAAFEAWGAKMWTNSNPPHTAWMGWEARAAVGAVAVDAAPQNPDSVHQVGATPQAAAALGHGTDDKCSRGG